MFDPHSCGWCGESTFGEDLGEVAKGPDYKARTDAESEENNILVHAEPCYTEALQNGWIQA